MLVTEVVFVLTSLFSVGSPHCTTCVAIHGDINLEAGATDGQLKEYENTLFLNGSIIIENTFLRIFRLPNLAKIECTTRPCVVIRNNSQLISIDLPELNEIIYKEQPADEPVVLLQGDALAITKDDVKTLKTLTGGHLTIEHEVVVDTNKYKFEKPPEFLHVDTVLLILCCGLVLFVIFQVLVSIVFLSRGLWLKRQEVIMTKGMLEVRSISINAKTSRYLVEDYQKKNPTKTFSEAVVDIKGTAGQMQPILNRRNRAVLRETIKHMKEKN
ncbi:hypothetical protein RB195_013785 [Necator americanus]|uniref:Receptor L-domain domain-containing protein n=1 Tax=Necator americanus TaxID=51031 RepID=A0ABR1DX88_NECAM